MGVIKLSADGSRLVYTAVLGDAQLIALAVDGAGHAYVAGNFAKPRSGVVGVYPVTANALQPTFGPACNQGDSDGVMAKLSPDGSQLLYSSFVGGQCLYTVAAIAVDPRGNVYVTGEGSTTAGYPATRAPFAPGGVTSSPFPGWIQVVAADFSRYVYSTLILADAGSPVVPSAIAVDVAGNAYVAGASGPGFPTTPGAFQPGPGAGASAPFLAKIAADGSRMVYGTYFGNASTRVNAVAADAAGNAYLAGHTGTGLPTANALQPALAGGLDAFVAKLNATGSSLGFSTYLGGRADDAAVGVGVDGAGNVYVAGPTDAIDFPQRNPLPPRFGGTASNFVTALTPTGTALVYSTYVADGQTAVHALTVTAGGVAYLTGGTVSAAFPTERALQPVFGGVTDAFITRIDPGAGGGTIRVFITAPAERATVSGTTWLTVWIENAATGDKTYTLSEGGTRVGAITTTSSNGPVSLAWPTAGGANGDRSVTVAVSDRDGKTGSASRILKVQNGGGGAPLVAAITGPANGATVSGIVTVGMSATNASGDADHVHPGGGRRPGLHGRGYRHHRVVRLEHGRRRHRRPHPHAQRSRRCRPHRRDHPDGDRRLQRWVGARHHHGTGRGHEGERHGVGRGVGRERRRRQQDIHAQRGRHVRQQRGGDEQRSHLAALAHDGRRQRHALRHRLRA